MYRILKGTLRNTRLRYKNYFFGLLHVQHLFRIYPHRYSFTASQDFILVCAIQWIGWVHWWGWGVSLGVVLAHWGGYGGSKGMLYLANRGDVHRWAISDCSMIGDIAQYDIGVRTIDFVIMVLVYMYI